MRAVGDLGTEESESEMTINRCRARIDGHHEWIYVGGMTARCVGCGAEKFWDPIASPHALDGTP